MGIGKSILKMRVPYRESQFVNAAYKCIENSRQLVGSATNQSFKLKNRGLL